MFRIWVTTWILCPNYCCRHRIRAHFNLVKTHVYLVKWKCISYLIWISYHKWKKEPSIFINKDVELTHEHGQDFWQAAFINLTNPKATILLITLFTQFIGPNTHIQTTAYLIMGITLILTDIIVMLGYASLAQRLSCLINSERRAIYQNRTFACLFFVVAMVIAIS
ncbi:MAG: hypothetical protein CENE_01849 [Candidatus Celerinatantimonas neptuna]|nr:MAG: hypothetical protein CENE_01849 [Candidatus Celerinatantimonas neptuna]